MRMNEFEGKLQGNEKETRRLPEGNQWKLIKSNSENDKLDNDNNTTEPNKKSKKIGTSNNDKNIQAYEGVTKKVEIMDSSSNLSSNVGKKIKKRTTKKDDEAKKSNIAMMTDQDSDLQHSFVINKSGPIYYYCEESRKWEINNNYKDSTCIHAPECHPKMPLSLLDQHSNQKSVKFCNQNTEYSICENEKIVELADPFGKRHQCYSRTMDELQNTNGRSDDYIKKSITTSDAQSPGRKKLNSIKSIFGQKQYPIATNCSKQGEDDIMHQMENSKKYFNAPPRDINHCMCHFSNNPHREFHQEKINSDRNERFCKCCIPDPIGHNPSNLNEDTPILQNHRRRHNQFPDEYEDFISQSKLHTLNNTHQPFTMNDDGDNNRLERKDYRITRPLPERIEIYYFDHGCSSYFRTTDQPPPLVTDMMIEKTDQFSTRFWARIFGFFHIIFAFITAFILQFFRFILISIVRPMLIGSFQVSSDYFLKPFLAILFNAIIQPFFILFYNIATSFRDLCEPIARGIGFFLEEIANVLRAIRLVEVKNNTRNGPFLTPFRNQGIEI